MTWFGWVLILIFALNIITTLINVDKKDLSFRILSITVSLLLIAGTLFVGSGMYH